MIILHVKDDNTTTISDNRCAILRAIELKYRTYT